MKQFEVSAEVTGLKDDFDPRIKNNFRLIKCKHGISYFSIYAYVISLGLLSA